MFSLSDLSFVDRLTAEHGGKMRTLDGKIEPTAE